MDSKQKADAIMQYCQLCELMTVATTPVEVTIPARVRVVAKAKKGGVHTNANIEPKKCMMFGL
jgi:hypothetical protein